MIVACQRCNGTNVVAVSNLSDRSSLSICVDCNLLTTDKEEGNRAWPFVFDFARAVAAKMATRESNADQAELEAGGPGWLSAKMYDLMARLGQELNELERAIYTSTSDEVMDEACDVAAFAMMIYSKAEAVKRHLKEQQDDSSSD